MVGNIIGNQNPVVGISYSYELNPLGLLGSLGSNYEWQIFKKQKTGRWKDITNTPKKGNKVTYQFGEIAMGIEFEMKVYEIKEGLLSGIGSSKNLIGTFSVIPTRNGVPKIDRVTLFNRGAKDVNKANYRDTLIAQAHCIALYNQEIEFHLWEDDAEGRGPNTEINKKNRHYKTYKAKVNENGLAEVKISLMSDEKILRQMANKFMMRGDQNEGAYHEYYVTASHAGKILGASQVNVNVDNPDYKKEKPQPQKDTPKFPENPKYNKIFPIKGNIIEAHFVNNQGEELSKIRVGDPLRVRIHSKNMVGKHIQYVIWEKDEISHDEIYRSKMIRIPGDVCDTYAIILDKDLFKKGINFPFGDPDLTEQHYFIEIISLDLSAQSVKFGVDMENGLLQVEQVKSPSIIQKSKVVEKKEKCFCNKDFEEKDVRKIVKLLKGSETIWEGQALKGGKRAECNISDKSFATLTKALNSAFKKYNINTCAQKMHFLAQVCEETGTFALSEETRSAYISSQSVYKGRGILQMTGVRINKDDFKSPFDKPGPYKEYADYKGDKSIISNPTIVANNVDYCIDSGAWMWSVSKKMPSDTNSKAFNHWDKKTAGKTLNELAIYVDDYLELISVLLNGRNEKTNMPNGWEKRKSNYDLLKTGFFMYDWYHKDKPKPSTTTGIVTYHIYADGKIERHIPKKIKTEHAKEYKYVYHDKDKKEHEICVVEWHLTQQKASGKNLGKIKPTHNKIISDKMVYEGQTDRRIKYENGDIAEYGTNKGKSFWNLYKARSEKVELVRMPDNLNLKNIGIVYSFSDTQRRFTCPGALAGFIGALAECKLPMVKTTGSCFVDATCFPSVAHVNGKSIDTKYLDKANETKFINAMNKFHFKDQITGNDGTHSYENTLHKFDHNDHLHSGFRESEIIIVYEK